MWGKGWSHYIKMGDNNKVNVTHFDIRRGKWKGSDLQKKMFQNAEKEEVEVNEIIFWKTSEVNYQVFYETSISQFLHLGIF